MDTSSIAQENGVILVYVMVALPGNLIEELAMTALRVCSRVVENEKMMHFIGRLKLRG
jgi:hypothetical protein